VRRYPSTYKGTRLYGAAVLPMETKNLFRIDNSGQNEPNDKIATVTSSEETGIDDYILLEFPEGVELTTNSWTVHKGRTYKPANPEAFARVRKEICEQKIPGQVDEWYSMLSDSSWSTKKLTYKGLEVTFVKEGTSIIVKAYVFECFDRTAILPNEYHINWGDYVQREKQMYIVEKVTQNDEAALRDVLTTILRRFLARACNMLPLQRLKFVSRVSQDLQWYDRATRVNRPDGW